MSAAVADLSEYRLHRDCERWATLRGDGLVSVKMPGCAYSVHPSVARDLAENLNDALRQALYKEGRGGWAVMRSNMLGAIVVRSPSGQVMPLNQEAAEVLTLALARAVGT